MQPASAYSWGQLPNASLAECRVFENYKQPFLSWHALSGTAHPGKHDLTPVASHTTSGGRTAEAQRLEAVLVLSREPLPSRKLAQYAGLEDGSQARAVIRQLNRWYDETGRSFRVEEVAGGFQLLTRKKFASWLRRLGHVPPEMRLSSPALETLAVVAYRQPVLKVDIEAIRGVNCGEILRQLMERDLVRISGRSEELGRPYLYSVTKRFLQLFGIRSPEDLPRAELIRAAPVPPVHKTPASAHHTSIESHENENQPSDEKECDVSVMLSSELAEEEKLARKFGAGITSPVRAEDDDDEDFEDDDFEEDDDDFEEDEDEEDFDDEDEEEEDLDDEDLEEEEWEEVDDEDEDFDDEDEDEDEDWDDEDEEDFDDDEDDDDWDDEEEEEEEDDE